MSGFDDIITFDMGGTSTDVCLVEKGRPHHTNLRHIEGYPIKTPMIDVHTVGAGGGSVAWIDSGGHLKVGPKSAGSDPGPVCYGRGGKEVTVTDANVVLQTLNPKYLLDGRMPIDAAAAKEAVSGLARQLNLDTMEVARGVISIVAANMVRAIRVISVQRGHDPRQFALVAFGGAGPLHACWVARELNIERVLIPKHPGIECAFGILVADMRSDFTLTRIIGAARENAKEVAGIFKELEAQAQDWMNQEKLAPEKRAMKRSVDVRYLGQNFELTMPPVRRPPGRRIHEKGGGPVPQGPRTPIRLFQHRTTGADGYLPGGGFGPATQDRFSAGRTGGYGYSARTGGPPHHVSG